MATPWYLEAGTPADGLAWWAVQHAGHPAFYLRALMPGDFQPPFAAPLMRHVVALDGTVSTSSESPRCGTCGDVVLGKTLRAFERRTQTEYLLNYRTKQTPWPSPTDPAGCWLCNDPQKRALVVTNIPEGVIRVCEPCHDHVERTR